MSRELCIFAPVKCRNADTPLLHNHMQLCKVMVCVPML